MTAYEKIAAEACQWCKIGNPVSYQGQHEIFSLGGKNRNQIENYKREPCTAPTKDAVIERLAAERDKLLGNLESSNNTYRIRGAENKRLREQLESRGEAMQGYLNSWEQALVSSDLSEDQHRLEAKAAIETIQYIRAENKRLREALEQAPHAPNCKSLSSFPVKCKRCKIDAALCPSDVKCFGFPEHEWVYRGLRPCSCWKAALAALPAQEVFQAENKRMREALEKAPHAPNCKYRPFETCIICGFRLPNHPRGKCLTSPENKWTPRSPVPCNCWKAALAAPAQETEAT